MSQNTQLDQFFPVTDSVPKIKVDSVELVREIKKHPMIYNIRQRRNKFSLSVAWDHVIAAVILNFETVKKIDKCTIRKKIRARWSWMRAAFRRYLSRNRLQHYSHVSWMKEMQFLLPFMSGRYKGNPAETNLEERGLYSRLNSSPDTTSNVVSSTSASLWLMLPIRSSSSHRIQQANDPNETLVKAFISTFCMEVFAISTDPDENFLITLLHVFRKVSPEQKPILKQKIDMFLEQ